MTVVGVTGKYCAGKSTAAELLVEAGYEEINVDALGHQALIRERARIIGRFGSEVADGETGIDRRRLGDIVFADADARRDLEAIVHPAMVSMVEEKLAAARSREHPPPGVAVNAALLIRMDLARLCDLVLYIRASLPVRIRRARERDGASLRQILRRIAAQRDVTSQFSGVDADIHSVRNDGSREQLRSVLRQLLPLP